MLPNFVAAAFRWRVKSDYHKNWLNYLQGPVETIWGLNVKTVVAMYTNCWNQSQRLQCQPQASQKTKLSQNPYHNCHNQWTTIAATHTTMVTFFIWLHWYNFSMKLWLALRQLWLIATIVNVAKVVVTPGLCDIILTCRPWRPPRNLAYVITPLWTLSSDLIGWRLDTQPFSCWSPLRWVVLLSYLYNDHLRNRLQVANRYILPVSY